MSFVRSGFNDQSKTFGYEDAGSMEMQPPRQSGTRKHPVAPSSVGGSVAGRSYVTSASRFTQRSATKVSERDEDRRPAYVRNTAAFLNYLYDRKNGRVLDRTLPNFFALMAAYLIFYVLVTILAAVSYIFFSYIIINEDTPHLTGDHNILRFSPALAMRPVPDYMGTLIRFRQTRPESYLFYTTHLQAYLDQYELFYNTERDVNIVDCDIRTQHRGSTDPNDPCRFDLEWLGPCSKQGFFGFPRGSPCVLLKLNRVYGWMPEIAPGNMSVNMLVRCQGKSDTDKETLGDIRYYPPEQVDGVEYGLLSPLFYPYLTQVGYRSPLVAAQFVNPRRNVVIMVECSVFNVLNIPGTGTPRVDKLTFELMID